jgi:alpha-tubulin suppressor-like RCC1 family protein
MNSRHISIFALACLTFGFLAGCSPVEAPTENPGPVFNLPTYSISSPTVAAPTAEPTVPSEPVIRAVAAGAKNTFALTGPGAVKCWGAGYLCDGSTLHLASPVDKKELSGGVLAVAAGGAHACALMEDGGVKCWGGNGFGELGNDTRTESSAPVDVAGLTSGVAAISAGSNHTCALTAAGGVKCWGQNDFGQLGDGTYNLSRTPVDALGLTAGVDAIEAGDIHTCAVLAGGGVKCWGWNGDGELGNNRTIEKPDRYNPFPTDVEGLNEPVVEVAAGHSNTCVRTVSGAVKCFGQRGNGQLGDGAAPGEPKMHSGAPVDVVGLPEPAAAIAVGGTSCALTVSGAVYCWGPNTGSDDPAVEFISYSAVPVSGMSGGALAVSAGWEHVCVLTGERTVKCWGFNDCGQLGDGTEGIDNNKRLPVDVIGLV